MTLPRLTAALLASLAVASPALAQQQAAPIAQQQAAPADVPPPPMDGTQLAAANRGVPVGKLTQAQLVTLQRVNAYFNSLSTVTANFEQTGPDGSRSVGKLYLSRPGKIRFQYAPPSPLEIISNGNSVAVKNRKLSTQELWPLSQTPLRFLLQDNIDLTKNANVLGVYQEPEMVSVVLEEKNAIGGKATIQLMFSGKDYQLKQWIVTDAQGMDTSVTLSDLSQVARLDDNLFTINLPRKQVGGRP